MLLQRHFLWVLQLRVIENCATSVMARSYNYLAQLMNNLKATPNQPLIAVSSDIGTDMADVFAVHFLRSCAKQV